MRWASRAENAAAIAGEVIPTPLGLLANLTPFQQKIISDDVIVQVNANLPDQGFIRRPRGFISGAGKVYHAKFITQGPWRLLFSPFNP
jgi:hypothetical protein